MSIKSKYNFKEASLGPNFAQEKFKDVKQLIEESVSFTTLAMPGIGVSYFLRYLTTTNLAYFVFVDMFSLASLTKLDFYKLLLSELGEKSDSGDLQQVLNQCKSALEKLTEKESKIVIVFNRFDELKDQFDKPFFANLRLLRNIDPDKIVMIFTANKPLYELSPQAISGHNLNLYSQVLYLKPYKDEDLRALIKLAPPPNLSVVKHSLDNLISLCGGHSQLLQLLLKSEVGGTPLLDRYAKLQLKELFDFLNYHQKKLVQKIAAGSFKGEVESYLLNIGMVSKEKDGYKLFSPLFTEFVLSQAKMKLPYKESKLFKLLQRNIDNVVSKDDIFNLIWADNPDNASNWALDALIYRLRKNHAFIQSGYIIESHKKLGYKLIKN